MARAPINPELYSSPAAHKVKPATATEQASRILLRRDKIIRGEGSGVEKRRFSLGKKEVGEHFEIDVKTKEQYRRFLGSHLQRVQKLQQANPEVLNDPLFAHDRQLLGRFVNPENGQVKHTEIDAFLRESDGPAWVATTLLLEQQIALKSFALAVRSNKYTTRPSRIMDSTLVDAMFTRMSANPNEVKYIQAVTALNIDDYTVSLTPGNYDLKPGKVAVGAGADLLTEINGNMDTRKSFYKSIGVNTRELDIFPEQAFLNSATENRQYEALNRFEGQQLVVGEFNEDGIRTLSTGVLDTVGNVGRFQEARVKVMTEVLRGIVGDRGTTDKRVSELDKKIGEVQQAPGIDIDKQIEPITASITRATAISDGVKEVADRVSGLEQEEKKLKALVDSIDGGKDLTKTPPVDYAPEDVKKLLLELKDRDPGRPVNIRGELVESVARRRTAFSATKKSRLNAIPGATPRGADEPGDNYSERLRAENQFVVDDMAIEKSLIDADEDLIKEVIKNVGDTEEKIKLAREGLSESAPEGQQGEKELQKIAESFAKVHGYDTTLAQVGVARVGLTEDDLIALPDDQVNIRINTAHTNAQTALAAAPLLMPLVNTAMTGQPKAAIADALGGVVGVWPSLAAEATRVAAIGTSTEAQVIAAVNAEATRIQDTLQNTGWAAAENGKDPQRVTVLEARVEARARRTERERNTHFATQEPHYQELVELGLSENQLRSLTREQVFEFVNKEHARSGRGWAAAANPTRIATLSDAEAIARGKPIARQLAAETIKSDLQKDKKKLEEQKTAGGPDSGLERMQIARAMAGRQEELFNAGFAMIISPGEYTSRVVPDAADKLYTNTEISPGVNLGYLRIANILTGYQDMGANREVVFKRFYTAFPPDTLRDMLAASFGVTDYRTTVGLVTTVHPVTTFDDVLQGLEQRLDRTYHVAHPTAPRTSRFEMVRGMNGIVDGIIDTELKRGS